METDYPERLPREELESRMYEPPQWRDSDYAKLEEYISACELAPLDELPDSMPGKEPDTPNCPPTTGPRLIKTTAGIALVVSVLSPATKALADTKPQEGQNPTRPAAVEANAESRTLMLDKVGSSIVLPPPSQPESPAVHDTPKAPSLKDEVWTHFQVLIDPGNPLNKTDNTVPSPPDPSILDNLGQKGQQTLDLGLPPAPAQAAPAPAPAEAAPAPTATAQQAPQGARPVTELNVTDDELSAITDFEGSYNLLYNDPVGNATIGVGHLVHLGPINGSEPAEFQHGLTPEQSRDLLRQDIQKVETAIENLVNVPLTQDEFNALTGLTFNIGDGNLKESTLLKLLNAGQYDAVREQFLKWNKANGHVLPGLTRRRQAEADLFGQSTPTQTAPAPETPPAPADVLNFDPLAAIGELIKRPAAEQPAVSPSQSTVKPKTPVMPSPQPSTAMQDGKESLRRIVEGLGKLYPDALSLQPPSSATENAPVPDYKDYIDNTTQETNSYGVKTVEVKGIRIRVEAALNLAHMLEAAEADGIILSSSPKGAYRSDADQAAVRVENGCSDGHCDVPTAAVGKSEHQSTRPDDPNNFAVDFRANGEPITSPGNAGYQWLKKHGPAYNFNNLASEPWHWSGTGK